MLTSPTQLLPQIVRPVEGDAKGSPSTLCISHDMEPKSQIPPHSSVSSSCDNGEGQAEKRHSERLQATPKEGRNKPKARKAAPKQSQAVASTKKVRNRRVAACGDENTAVSESFKHKDIKGPSQNMARPSARNQVDCTTTDKSMQELQSCEMAKDKESAKSWVIGPLFHSFKSKMSSFTEIVMSPVRLFKPTDLPPSDAKGMEDEEALSFSKTSDRTSEHVHDQQACVSKTLRFDGSSNEVTVEDEQEGTEGELKVKMEQPESQHQSASSRLTRGALLRGEGLACPDPLKSRSNQSARHSPAGLCGNSSNNVSERQTLQRRPQIRQAAQKKSVSPDYAMKTNTVSSAESCQVLCNNLKQLKNVDDLPDVKTSSLSDSSVFYTPPDSFSKDEGTPEQEDLKESTPIQNTQIRSSPRKLPKSISVTPAPFAVKRESSRQKVTGRKVTFDIKVKVEDEEEKVESQRSSEDEELDLSPESSPDTEATLRRPQLRQRKRTRKPLHADADWAVKAKRRVKAGKVEGATRRRGRSKDVAPKECLSEWLETSEEILYTRTTDRDLTDSGGDLLSNSQSTADTEMSEMNVSDIDLKFEGSSRLTRGQAKSKQSTPARVKVDPLENEYADIFTDCLAVSLYAENDKSLNDKSINGRDKEDGITGSLSRKPRQWAKKTAVSDDSSLVASKSTVKLEDDHSSVFSPVMENSSGSFLNSLAQSNCKSAKSSKRRLMKKRGQMYGEEFPDDSPSASILKLDNTISEMCVRGEKKRLEESEQTQKDNDSDEVEQTPSKRERGKALKRKSPSPCTKESRVDGTENEEEDDDAFIDTERPPEATTSGSGSNRLLRSYSCPEIASLSHREQLWRSPTLLPHGRAPPVPAPHHPVVNPAPHLPPSPSKRTRRHTVCSLEIEREIAPLCLRKEVYPTGRCGLYGSPSHPLCPSTASPSTFTALVSSFLSSPLAFLSRRSDRGKRKAREDDSLITTSSSSSFSTTSTSSHPLSPSVTPPCSTSSPPFALGPAVHHSLAGFTCSAPPRSSLISASVSPGCSHFQVSSEGEDDSGQQSEDGEENGGNLSLDLLSRQMPEEKALSDSEIKMETKQGEQRKVSSIRIRKTLPKPLNNLTPMGLPKLIRPKKKEFSVEEIYTNKNFTKPAEGRLETIFEDPLKRRDGSHCLLGQKRVKRFVEFPEIGKARKLRKPLVIAGTGSSSSTQKTVGQSSGGRPRRGVWSTSKDDPQPSPEDLDSLLCSKLDQLDSLMAVEEGSS
ncbi:nucleolar protein dao-5 isoform X2 [Sardina pilchardus]|uniref:nucleolar protein dao-5 isoform X2 n=1 Tax=Sardina pilchardus TaxID=27697 RepID=UPI002E11C893